MHVPEHGSKSHNIEEQNGHVGDWAVRLKSLAFAHHSAVEVVMSLDLDAFIYMMLKHRTEAKAGASGNGRKRATTSV